MNKTTRIFLFLILMLSAIFLLIRTLREYKIVKRIKMTKEKVSSVIIKHGTNIINLTKEGLEWKVNEFKASKETVEDILDKISNIRVGEVISEKESDIDEFWLDESTNGIVVEITSGKKKDKFIIGKSAGFETAYFRYPSQKKIFLAYNLWRYAFEKNIDEWREKNILKLDRQTVGKISIKNKQYIILEQRENKWYITQPKPEKEIEIAKIDGFLNTLLSFQADGFIYEKVDFSKPSLTLEIDSKVGEFKVEIKPKNADYAVKKQGDETIYKIFKYKYDNLNFSLNKL